MGCFSYRCNECGAGVRSDHTLREPCTIFRLEKGVVVEQMTGAYDSYGRVLDSEGKSIEWKLDWQECVENHFNSDESTGFAIVHTRCNTGVIPTVISDDDPNQGWGEDVYECENCGDTLEYEGAALCYSCECVAEENEEDYY